MIRIWEKRYRAVEPSRTETNRRLYSEGEIARLSLLRSLTESGHSIGQVAKLSEEQMRAMLQEDAKAAPSAPRFLLPAEQRSTSRPPASGDVKPAKHVEACLAAVRALDARALESALTEAEVELGGLGLLQEVVAPFVQLMGQLWREGSISAAHEHFATAVLRVFLAQASRTYADSADAPTLQVATPVGQLHELGALLVAATAATLGWRISYLGASLPAAEMVGALRQNRANALALSLVYPEDDPRVDVELRRIRALLPPDFPILVGGRAAPAYRETVREIRAIAVSDLADLGRALDTLRGARSTSSTGAHGNGP